MLLASFAVVLVAALVAPWLRTAPAAERICSAQPQVQWRVVDWQGVGESSPSAHGIDCPLCPPLWAPESAAPRLHLQALGVCAVPTHWAAAPLGSVSRKAHRARAPPRGYLQLAGWA